MRTKTGLLICAVAVFIVGRVFVNETGFCAPKLKFMSNDDIRRALIENEIPKIFVHTGKVSVSETWTGKRYRFGPPKDSDERVLAYRTVGEFLIVNPECCNIPGEFDDFGPPTVGPIMYLMGWRRSTNWIFREKYINSDGNVSTTEKHQSSSGAFYVSNCGEKYQAPHQYNIIW